MTPTTKNITTKLLGALSAALALSSTISILTISRTSFGATTFPNHGYFTKIAEVLLNTFGAACIVPIWLFALIAIQVFKPTLLRRNFAEMLCLGIISMLSASIFLNFLGFGGFMGASFFKLFATAHWSVKAIIALATLAISAASVYFSFNLAPEHFGKVKNLLSRHPKPTEHSRAGGNPLPTKIINEPIKKPTPKPIVIASDSAYILPSLALLNPPPRDNITVNDDINRKKAVMLEQTLAQFGKEVKITNFNTGPVITLFEMEIGKGIKTASITALSEDIAREMSALSARIALIQGTNKVGIELPNLHRKMVSLKTQFESEEFINAEGALPISLGSDTNGKPVIVDLAKMPHLLIAGTTGSGKSVGVNGMILSLLYRYTPDEVKFIMIDPKMLEFAMYKDIPHLLIPVVIDPVKAVAALKWAVREMEERNRNMSALGAKNIESYNEKARANPGKTIKCEVQTGFDPSNGEPIMEDKVIEVKPMPYIVVVVDEMADLMLVAGKEVEAAIARLAAMARAAGIHLILSTQRPSVDVITGTIKSNFPNRVAYRVASKIDSRTIINEQGAELMLGKGDMLYMAMGGNLIRIHGAFVSEEEIERVVRHIKREAKPNYVPSITDEKPKDASSMSLLDRTVFKDDKEASDEDLYRQAVQIILQSDRPSISFLQRQLGIGYNKSANLIEKMQQAGLLSAPDSQGKRVVLGKK